MAKEGEKLKTALHELLAVDKDVRKTAEKVIAEGNATFRSRQDHFDGHQKVYDPLDENDPEIFTPERKEVVETVPSKVEYIEDMVANLMDVILQKEKANQEASADIIIVQKDGSEQIILTDVPASALVQYETILERLRSQVYNVVPTLKPGPAWSPDTEKGKGYYRYDEGRKPRTRKTDQPLVLYEATKDHPAQTTVKQVDVVAGYWTTTHWTGRISPAEKSDLLERVEKMLTAVRTARSRANEAKVTNLHGGRKIFNFIRGL